MSESENWRPKIPNPDLWRALHSPSETNPVCECAGDHICCPCTLSDALEELSRLRASHARLLALVRAMLTNEPDDMAADAVTVLDVWRKEAQVTIAAAEGGGRCPPKK